VGGQLVAPVAALGVQRGLWGVQRRRRGLVVVLLVVAVLML
jgi:hypothetical protein